MVLKVFFFYSFSVVTFLVCTIAKMADPVIPGMMSFLIIFYVFSVADPYTDLMNKKSNSV